MGQKKKDINLSYESIEELAKQALHQNNWKEKHEIKKEKSFYSPGQSKRIYKELYKVIDSSDCVVFVVDAR